ncbi:ATP-dependent Clp protease ATP-binding subunit [Patescibacteria group bacterium]|nr:ATP-dependent Clp protease ATP-binding subunit [Patescibacteria group bacterium]
MPQEQNIIFNPHLNLLRITQRKLKTILGRLIFILLILFGFYGIRALIMGFINIFYISLLTDMFLFYLWQRREERINRIFEKESLNQVEVSVFLDKSAQTVLDSAWLLAYRRGFRSLRPIHLFASLLKGKDFKKILKRLDCQPKQVIAKTKKILSSPSFFSESDKGVMILGPKISSDSKEIFVNAYLFCLEKNKQQIDVLDILWAISKQKNLVGMIFDEFGVGPQEIEQVVEWAQLEKEIIKRESSFTWHRFFKPKGKLNRTMTAALTPLLDKVSRDLTFLARQGQFEVVIGRQKEISQVFNFFNAGQIGVVLVGPDAIGKKAIFKKIAQLMVTENVPKFLADKRLVQLDLGSLVSLTNAREKSEEYLRQIVFEINRAGNIILVIENIDSLAGLRSQASGLDMAEILSTALDQKLFFFIGTTTEDGFASKIEGKILGRSLNKINVPLPSRDVLWQILITKIYLIEKELKILFSVDALKQAIDLADRYVYGKALPAKVMDLLSEVGYKIRQQKGVNSFVEGSDVTDLISEKTQIPLGQIDETEKEKLLGMEGLIHQDVINQEEAIKAISEAMRRSRLDLQSRKKPIANFLFVGPTGVGKTETAKTLARVYFGSEHSEERMIRLDMSEYQEKRGLRRLIGSRTEQETNKGYLTEAVKRQPYSLILLDEIEKAHPDILNLFLQVMDDGRLTDISGETINFTNVILIATSNAGTHFVQQKIAKKTPYQEVEEEMKQKVLLEYFRPEFLNRFDGIILFKALTMDNMSQITQLFLKSFEKKLEEKGITFEAEPEAVEELAQKGYDPLYGARPLRRVIQDLVESRVAEMLLENKLKRRDTLILKKGLEFEIKEAPEI